MVETEKKGGREPGKGGKISRLLIFPTAVYAIPLNVAAIDVTDGVHTGARFSISN